MASRSIRLNKSLMVKVAYRVNELVMEEYKSDPYATLEGYVPSEKYTKAMEELVYNFKVRKISKPIKTIIVIAAILALLLGCAMGVTAVRRAVREFVLLIGNNHAVVTCEVEADTNGAVVEELSEIEIYYEPSYVPEGFVKIESIYDYTICKLIYSDGINDCIYTQLIPGAVSTMDSDGDVFYSTSINGNDAFYRIDDSNKVVHLRWSDNTYIYAIVLYSSIDSITVDEVIKMASSLVVVN